MEVMVSMLSSSGLACSRVRPGSPRNSGAPGWCGCHPRLLALNCAFRYWDRTTQFVTRHRNRPLVTRWRLCGSFPKLKLAPLRGSLRVSRASLIVNCPERLLRLVSALRKLPHEADMDRAERNTPLSPPLYTTVSMLSHSFEGISNMTYAGCRAGRAHARNTRRLRSSVCRGI